MAIGKVYDAGTIPHTQTPAPQITDVVNDSYKIITTPV